MQLHAVEVHSSEICLCCFSALDAVAHEISEAFLLVFSFSFPGNVNVLEFPYEALEDNNSCNATAITQHIQP